MVISGIKDIVNNGCKLTDSGNVLSVSGDTGCGVALPRFTTLSDAVRIRARGKVESGELVLSLYGINSASEKLLHREDRLCEGEFEISYDFDPINLAVYRDMQGFCAELEIISESAELMLTELSAEEVGAQTDTSEKTEKPSAKGSAKFCGKAPSSMLFIGNSLVFGMQMNYGMCATAPDKDYFHYVSSYVKSVSPDCKFKKLYGSGFEHCETLDAFERWYSGEDNQYTGSPSCESFTDDIDLIILQMGDNINTDDKNATFKISGDLLIERIKRSAPHARLIWVHGWYNRQPTYDYIASLCDRWGIERIDIRDLRCAANENHTDETFIDKNGEPAPIKDTWRTHPGNLGMKAIAERIIENLGF